MNTAVRTRAGIALAGAALLMGGLTACGEGAAAGDGGTSADAKAHEPATALKAAYQKTVAAKTAHAEITTVGADGKSSGESGTKAWYPAGHDVVLKGGDEPDNRSIMLGDTVYTQLDKPLQDGKTWMKMDLSKDGKPGVRLNGDPAEYLGMLLGQQKATHVGAGTTDGVEAQHYKAVLTNAELVTADDSTKVMEEQHRQYLHEAVRHLTAFEVDLWIGKDGLPVRVDSVQTDAKGTVRTTAKFSGYGTAPAVQPPPADQVADFREVMQGVDATLLETDKKLKEAGEDLKEADKTLRDAGLGGLGGLGGS
ncbi:hypothetical protein ACFYUL_04810 [Streptomyces sp. NPDC004311]|uniref:hypothetical protein n=1 Tax=Streptomyces sp. NPDC004311 TaxID=3364698 RepID=UPI0036A72662